MNSLIGDNFGLVHLISGITALIFGSLVLILKKGTKIHRRIGYLYVFSMLILILSSFGIYRLFGKFGLFHIFSLVSTFSLAMGMLPMLKKTRGPKDYETHFKRMYWSVVGLFAAFAAESFVRIPKFGGFWTAVAWSFIIVSISCLVVFIKMRPVWSNKFGVGKAKKIEDLG